MVLGSNSFSGSHFVGSLLQRGHSVLGIGRSRELSRVFQPFDKHNFKNSYSFARANLNNPLRIAGLISDYQPDIVVNFAAQSMVAESWNSPEDWYQANVVGLSRLVHILEQVPTLKRYVHVSTPEVYGSTSGWTTENRKFSPTTPYAISRAAGDFHLFAMHEARGFPVCLTRAANVYGPGQRLYRIVPRSMLAARTGQTIQLDGGGLSMRSFIFVDDVVEATYLVSEKGQPGTEYHISTDEVISIRELVGNIADLAGVDFETLVTFGPERPGKDSQYMLDSSRIRAELGWQPQKVIGDGLNDTLDWVDRHFSSLRKMKHSYSHKR